MANSSGGVEILRISGIPVRIHWSALLMLLVPVLLNKHSDALGITVVFGAFLVLILVHELGHAWVARRCGLKVYSLRIGGFHGLCFYEMPRFQRHAVAVAWGGVLAQGILAAASILVALAISFFGVTVPPVLGGVFLVFVPISAAIAVFNLLPIPPLDGATAWQVFSLLLGKEPPPQAKKSAMRPPSDARVAGKIGLDEWRRSRQTVAVPKEGDAQPPPISPDPEK